MSVYVALLLGMAGDGPVLRDASAGSGVDFRFDGGSRGKSDLPEIMGGGVALIDVDCDGLLDLFFCQGGPIELKPEAIDPPCRLYRNLGDFRFVDITDRAGAPGPSYAMGVAVGDIDDDGRDDLLVTGWRGRRLYKSRGDGTFEDITASSGLGEGPGLWGTSAVLADLDGDADLDIYIAHYVDYDPAKAPFCAAPDGKRDYCGPGDFPWQPDQMFENRSGRFVPVPLVDLEEHHRGLGVVAAELTGDGKPDLYIAEDNARCRLLENGGGLRFDEVGRASGVAFDGTGGILAGMGVALADVDGDGRDELAVANFLSRGTVLFQGLGAGQYRDISKSSRVLRWTAPVLGFGLVLCDLDGDGDPDLLQANGHVLDRARFKEPFAMPMTLLVNRGGRLDPPEIVPEWLATPRIGRGLAVGDLDSDGDPDVVTTSLDKPPLLLKNETPGVAWLGLALRPSRGPAGAVVGARVWASIADRTIVRPWTVGGSYLSAGEARIALGLGKARAADRLVVRWPDGRREAFGPLPAAPSVELREGTGRPEPD